VPSTAFIACHPRQLPKKEETVNYKSMPLRRIIRLRYILLAALVAPVLVAGCSTVKVGREFNYQSFASKVKPGTTDMAQVSSILGPPMGKGLVAEADGSLYDQWTYYYGNGDLSNTDKSRFKLLQLRFDQGGKLASYNWSGEMSGAAPVDDKTAKK
jgi:outer membrane protein assembly factor BamE (lipoprotein component of BamABCDE complex)